MCLNCMGGEKGFYLPEGQECMLRNNGEIVVKTKDQLRSLTLGPAHAPCAFAYRNGKHTMVLSGSSDGTIAEFFVLKVWSRLSDGPAKWNGCVGAWHG